MKRLLILIMCCCLGVVGCKNDNANDIPNIPEYDSPLFDFSVEVPTNELWYLATAPVITQNAFSDSAMVEVSNEWDETIGFGRITFDGELTTISMFAYSCNEALSGIRLPKSVKKIESNAFAECVNLEYVYLNEGLEVIEEYAFNGCSKLQHITTPKSLTAIFRGAFASCKSLEEFTITNSVTTLDYGVFEACVGLKRFNGKYATNDGYALIVDGSLKAFALGCGLVEYAVPNEVEEIGMLAFANSMLRSITVPEDVDIGEYAFAYSKELERVHLSRGVKLSGGYIFEGCTSLREFSGEYATSDGRALIYGEHLFYAIGHPAIEYVVPEEAKAIGLGAFAFAPYLERVTLHNDIIAICEQAFRNCQALTTINIPDSVVSLYDSAFTNCQQLREVTIGSGVVSIPVMCFHHCTALESIFIPRNVEVIEFGAFYGCISLESVYCEPETPPTMRTYGDMPNQYNYSFDYQADNRKIYVPHIAVDAYKGNNGWSLLADSIEGYTF